MDYVKKVINEISCLITDTVMTEQEGDRRCITTEDLNGFEQWITWLNKASEGNPDDLKNANCAIFDVRASALIKAFAEWSKKYPKGRIYSINSKDGMEMIRELDELADESQELSKHLP